MATSPPWRESAGFRYAIHGAVIGVCFAILATMVDLLTRNLVFSVSSIIAVQRTQPIHWVIDAFPLLFAVLGWLTGRRQDIYARFNAELEAKVEERTAELRQANESLKSEIDERLRIEEELRRAREAADEANRAKGQFLARMSHEIRTPMNAIIGMTHLALKTDLSAKQRDYIGKAQAAAKVLLGIINDILDFSKIEAGKMTIESVDFHLDEVLDNVADLVRTRAEEKGLELLFATDERVPFCLVGDPLRLGQVLTNLVANAVKFTDEGEVVIRTAVAGQNSDHVVLRFSVQDTGIGLTEEQIGKLFQSFSQAEETTTRRFGGTGLGLAICKRIVDMMGGSIGVTSEPGKGSAFTFTARFGVRRMELERARKPPLDIRGTRALVVDDNATAREVLSEALSAFSFQVKAVASGQEAITEIKSAEADDEPYRLVLMDWKMPGMDGIEAAVSIKNSLALARPPAVILVTAYGREDVVQRAEAASLDGFLTKPIGPSALFDGIMEALGERIVEISRAGSQAAPLDAERTGSLAGAQILLVEDNAINQQIAVEMLEQAGATVTVASNGAEAVRAVSETAAQNGFGAILMDVQMPEMDGYEATRRLRTDGRFGDLPIIAMTAHALDSEREKCLDAGMNDHIAKPIDPDALFGTLAKWIPSARRETEGHEDSAQKQAEKQEAFPQIDGVDTQTALARLGGNETLYEVLLLNFRRNYERAAEDIEEAVNSGRIDEARRIAHTLRGVAGNIGAAQVLERARRVEDALKSGDHRSLPPLLTDLKTALEDVIGALAQIETQKKPDPEQGREDTAKLDLDEIGRLFAEALALFDSDFSAAAARVEQLGHHLRGTPAADAFRELEGHVAEFDTDAARRSAAALANQLGIRLDGKT